MGNISSKEHKNLDVAYYATSSSVAIAKTCCFHENVSKFRGLLVIKYKTKSTVWPGKFEMPAKRD